MKNSKPTVIVYFDIAKEGNRQLVNEYEFGLIEDAVRLLHICAISYSGDKEFFCQIDQRHYGQSFEFAIKKLISFVEEECLVKAHNEKVIYFDGTLGAIPIVKNGDGSWHFYSNLFDYLAYNRDWNITYMNDEYYTKLAHIENPLSFEMFFKYEGDVDQDFPKKLLDKYKSYERLIDKGIFNNVELRRMINFLKENVSKFFEKKYEEIRGFSYNYTNALYAICVQDKELFNEIFKFIGEYARENNFPRDFCYLLDSLIFRYEKENIGSGVYTFLEDNVVLSPELKTWIDSILPQYLQ